MDVVGVGFIGCGRIADLHARGYEGNPEARLHAVCDVDADTAASARQRWGAEVAYTDHRELLADPRVDAVEILTPHHLHEPLILEALARGKHVSVQKPMTISLASADRVLAAAARSDRVFRVADNYMFYPPIVRARELITGGAIGEPSTLRIKFTSGTGGWTVPASAWEWRVKERLEGRPFQTFDHGHHLWAVASFLLGGIEHVAAWIDTADGMVDSPATVMWKYRDEIAYGTCDYAHAASMNVPSNYYANDESFEITGTDGIILIARCTGHIVDGPVLRVFNGTSWKTITRFPRTGPRDSSDRPATSSPRSGGGSRRSSTGRRRARYCRWTWRSRGRHACAARLPRGDGQALPDLHALGRRRQDARSHPLRPPGTPGRRKDGSVRAAGGGADPRPGVQVRPGRGRRLGLRHRPASHRGRRGGGARFGLYVRDGTAELNEGPSPRTPSS